MASQPIKRSTLIAVFSDQRRTKSTISSRTSGATHWPFRSPQDFFLARRARSSARRELRSWSGSFARAARCVLALADAGCEACSRRRRRRFQRTLFANGRTESARVRARRKASRRVLSPAGVASGWRLSLEQCSASGTFSCVSSAILAAERSLLFQLGQDRTNCLVGIERLRSFSIPCQQP